MELEWQENIGQIESNIQKGLLDEGLEIIYEMERDSPISIDSLEKLSEIPKGDQQTFIEVAILKSRLLQEKRDYKEALEVASHALQASRDFGFTKYEFGASIQQAYVLWILDRLDEGLAAIEKGEELFQVIKDKTDPQLLEWQATLFHVKGGVLRFRGDLTSGLDCIHKCLELRETLGLKRDMAFTLNNIGHIHHELGEGIKLLTAITRL